MYNLAVRGRRLVLGVTCEQAAFRCLIIYYKTASVGVNFEPTSIQFCSVQVLDHAMCSVITMLLL